ncbi:MAG TPA: glycoside hydrolase family 27 protein [Terriglobales bacterium]|nr:glycoside hydrolase family 27 protein [Terriglobales bacterium]HXY49006.1 glycoside hydrolase family 27 protein [Terriglobales bacterium]
MPTLLLSCTQQIAPVVDPMPPAPHPPMGWNSWYAFGDSISDSLIRQQADAMIANGMYQAGYNYVNLDDGWQGYRDALGFLQPNSNFPDMKGLADYLHSRGLKFGIYTSTGINSCGGFVGSKGYEEQDAQTFLNWGADFVKYDAICDYTTDVTTRIALIRKLSFALRSQETHPVVLSIVMLHSPWNWARSIAVNMWRISPDAKDSYRNMMQTADVDAPLARYASQTGWNDPDMLQVGRDGMTANEYRTHMTLWAMLSAPLLAGTDLRSISPSNLEILTNAEAIAINQDTEGHQANRVLHSPSLDLWVKTLSGGSAIAIINRGERSATFMANDTVLGIDAAQVYDVWTKQTVSLPRSFRLEAHSCVLLKTLQPTATE